MDISGTIMDFLVVFGLGVAVSFTPCVYPVMPLTASFIAGANASGTQTRAFFISLVYVSGMAIVYACLGIFAAMTGKIFGQIQNTPVFYSVIGVLLILCALVMFDKIAMPVLGVTGGARKVKPGNLWMVFLFGMTSGLIVGPCTAPVLGAILTYIASKQNIVRGVALMFTFAYGVGFSLILIGTFSALLGRIPKSGIWLNRVKQLTGAVLLAAGFYFIYKAVHVFMVK